MSLENASNLNSKSEENGAVVYFEKTEMIYLALPYYYYLFAFIYRYKKLNSISKSGYY